jgi:hypothetical protein
LARCGSVSPGGLVPSMPVETTGSRTTGAYHGGKAVPGRRAADPEGRPGLFKIDLLAMDLTAVRHVEALWDSARPVWP